MTLRLLDAKYRVTEDTTLKQRRENEKMRSFCSPLIALCAGVQMTPAHAARGGGGGGAGQTGPQSLAVDASGNTDPEDGFSDVVTDEGDEHKPSPPKQGMNVGLESWPLKLNGRNGPPLGVSSIR